MKDLIKLIPPMAEIVFWIVVWAVIIVATILFFGGCVYNKPMTKLANVMKAWDTACAIEYVPEPPGEDFWQDPVVTLKTNKGDCEDKAIVLWWLLRHVHKIKDVYLKLLRADNATIANRCYDPRRSQKAGRWAWKAVED